MSSTVGVKGLGGYLTMYRNSEQHLPRLTINDCLNDGNKTQVCFVTLLTSLRPDSVLYCCYGYCCVGVKLCLSETAAAEGPIAHIPFDNMKMMCKNIDGKNRKIRQSS